MGLFDGNDSTLPEDRAAPLVMFPAVNGLDAIDRAVREEASSTRLLSFIQCPMTEWEV